MSTTDPECGTAPFDYTMTLLLEVTAIKPDQNPIGQVNLDVSTDINVINPCANDALTFQSAIQSQLYGVQQETISETLNPGLFQTYPQCLRNCELTGDQFDLSMFSFNSQTGVVGIATSQLSLHNVSYNMELTCTSLENGDTITNLFTIAFQDSCLTTEFAFPEFSTLSVDLYTTEI